MEYTKELIFELIDDGTSYTVFGISDLTISEIYIPNEYNSLPVTQIKASAFRDNTSITKVYCPINMSMINSYAFMDCTNLKILVFEENYPSCGGSVTWGSSLSEIHLNNPSNIDAFWKGYQLASFFNTQSDIHPKLFINGIEVDDLLINNNISLKNVETDSRLINNPFNSITFLKRDSVPEISDFNMQGLYYSGTTVYVQEDLYEEWIATEVWSEIADQIKVKNVFHIADSSIADYQYFAEYTNNTLTVFLDKYLIYPGYAGIMGDLLGTPEELGYSEVKKFIINDERIVSLSGICDNCSLLEEVILHENIISIAGFENCINLKTINLPKKLESIKAGAFQGCTALSEIKLPNNLKEISLWAFEDCTSLKRIIIPKSVEEIGESAFLNCTKLIILVEADEIPSTWDENWNYSNCRVIFLKNIISIMRYKTKNNFKITHAYRFNGEKWEILDINYLSKDGYIRIGG